MLFGILILEAGVWSLASKLPPDERCYLDLRAEVEHVIGLIPELNASVVERLDREGSEENEERFKKSLNSCTLVLDE